MQQGIRHEWVTVLMLKQLREWLLPTVDESKTISQSSNGPLLGHHPAHDHASPPKDTPKNGRRRRLSFSVAISICASLEWLARRSN